MKKPNNKAKTLKRIPNFKSEDEEIRFWDTHDSTDYIDWSKARYVIFPNLKLTRQPISLRVTTSLLAKVKVVANKKDMPYQTLMKQYISEGVENDFQSS
ncbi:MAG: BrnA antitoxin family protein [Patescibacteria group bacterium]